MGYNIVYYFTNASEKEKLMQDLKKIVITGGPCAGKTTAMGWIKNALEPMGYTVLFVPETATELICGGVAPWTCGTSLEYQICQMQLQIAKEEIFSKAAKTMPAEKILIVCDRGMLDNKAYMQQDDFEKALYAINSDEVTLRDNYDAVFHLVTAAKGAQKFYTTAGNNARTETLQEAAALDDKLISAWTGHPHLRIIGNDGSFEDKMKALVAEISSFLGEPEPLEIERKFLIEYPDINLLESSEFCNKVDIEQTYLENAAGERFRLRRRGINGNYIYYHTYKEKISDIKRIEIEKRISKSEYDEFLSNTKSQKHTISKTRYCLVYENQYFEIDVYPFWKDKAIMEIELCNENCKVNLPDCINVIKEVSDDDAFSNFSLAKNYGK